MTGTDFASLSSFLVDTNVLVYAWSQDAPAKKEQAVQFLTQASLNPKGYLSVQNLAEFAHVFLRKLNTPDQEQLLEDLIQTYSSVFSVLRYSHVTVMNAAKTAQKYSMPFWDSLLAETMKEAEISIIFTENEKDFRKLPGLTVINPFKSRAK